MTEDRCERTDLYVSQCGHCRGHVAPDEEAARDRASVVGEPGWIEAVYRGKCSNCGDWFPEGTPIRRTGGGWLAACCADVVAS